MKTSDFMYDLPEELIAQTPVEPRDHSRLMVVNRDTGAIEHKHFYDVIDYLNPGDSLIINETRVIPARLIGERAGGGACEILLLKQLGPKKWETLVRPGKKLRAGAAVTFGGGKLKAVIAGDTDAGGTGAPESRLLIRQSISRSRFRTSARTRSIATWARRRLSATCARWA